MTVGEFSSIPAVLNALNRPRLPSSILNYIFACDTDTSQALKNLNNDEKVEPLLEIWFQSGDALDKLCQPFATVVKELKNEPATLVGEEWDTLKGKVAKVLLADQLSRSCFRGTSEAFSFDHIAQKLVREAFRSYNCQETLKLPAAILYLLPWGLAHSENARDLDRACQIIDMTIEAYPNFNLFVSKNKPAVIQHRQVLEKFGRYPQRNLQLRRQNTSEEKLWLSDKENLPVWAGGNSIL